LQKIRNHAAKVKTLDATGLTLSLEPTLLLTVAEVLAGTGAGISCDGTMQLLLLASHVPLFGAQ